jgi:hypothetical protein
VRSHAWIAKSSNPRSAILPNVSIPLRSRTSGSGIRSSRELEIPTEADVVMESNEGRRGDELQVSVHIEPFPKFLANHPCLMG